MKLNRTENAKKNMIFGFVNMAVSVLFPFIVRTAMIQALGAEYLGLNGLFSSILQVLSLSELGFGSAIVYSMYKPIADDNVPEICALLNYYKKIYKVIGITIGIIGLGLLPFLPKLISGSYPSDINLYICYLLYLFNTVITYLMFAYKASILNAFQRTDIISKINTFTQGMLSVIQILVLFTIKNYYVYLLFMPIASIVNNILLSFFVDRLYPQYHSKGILSRKTKEDIKIKVKGLMIYRLCTTTRNSFDSIFISAFLGLTAAAMYANYFYIVSALNMFVGIIISSMQAGIGNSIKMESMEKNYEDMKRLNYIYMLVCGWLTICMVCLYQPFMKLWVGEEFMFSNGIAVLFSLYFYALKMGDIRGLYSDAAGLWWENRYRTITEAGLNLVLNYCLVRIWGVYGIILATLISLLMLGFGYSSQILFKVYFKDKKLSDFFKAHFRYFLATLMAGSITYWICSKISGTDWAVLLLRAVLCCIVPVAVYILLYFYTKEFKEAFSWILEKLKIKK